MKNYVTLLLFLSTIISACVPQPQQATSLVGTWKLTAYGPKDAATPAVPDVNASLTFSDDGTVGGSSGCNSLGGTYKVDGNEITFREITSTLMACDDARMAQEGAVTQVLSGTAQYEIENNVLTLTNKDMVLVFSAAENSYPYP
jgi:heat shock protein HslJ